jgi:hypothetical protein
MRSDLAGWSMLAKSNLSYEHLDAVQIPKNIDERLIYYSLCHLSLLEFTPAFVTIRDYSFDSLSFDY